MKPNIYRALGFVPQPNLQKLFNPRDLMTCLSPRGQATGSKKSQGSRKSQNVGFVGITELLIVFQQLPKKR